MSKDPVRPAVPRWCAEIDTCLSISPQFLLTGNIGDVYLTGDPAGRTRPGDLIETLWKVLQRSGFDGLVVMDPVDRLYVHPATTDASWLPPGNRGAYLDDLAEVAESVVGRREQRVALVVRYASGLITSLNALTDPERDFFVRMRKLAAEAVRNPAGGRSVFNALFWLLDRDRDVPAFFASNEAVRITSIPLPSVTERSAMAEQSLHRMIGFKDLADGARAEAVLQLAGQSAGLTLREVQAAALLAVDQRIPFAEIADAVRTIRLGVRDNPWKEARGRIARADQVLHRRVKGQPAAVARAADLLMRSSAGLTGAHVGRDVRRPRGVLFLAGPTGVGKTELAKAITSLVFGDESAYSRFDMSEFSAEHAGERLVGAPPGYVGYDAGGELTNAVRERPFSLLLFDEVEKAHPRILDKFLQILEDGRLTDGTGSTVHFSECIIVFTSNLGMYRTVTVDGATVRTPNPDAAPGQPYERLDAAVRESIQEHFRIDLQRPELFNRLGDNIVVFDYIAVQTAAEILDLMLDNVVAHVLRELGVGIELDPAPRQAMLDEWARRPELGGRGVGSIVETAVINTLSRAVFELAPAAGTRLRLKALARVASTWQAQWSAP